MSDIVSSQLLHDIRQLLIASRQTVVQAINSAMVQTYWQIGCLIVEDEQQGQTKPCRIWQTTVRTPIASPANRVW